MLEKSNVSENKLSAEQILRLKLAVESGLKTDAELSELLKEFGFQGKDPVDVLFDALEHLDEWIFINKKSELSKQN